MSTESPIAQNVLPSVVFDKKEQLKFAERCFVNAQELNRFMDQKSGFVIATVGVLSASIAALGKDILLAKDYTGWQLYFQAAGGCLALFYFGYAFATLYSAAQVFTASPHALKTSSHSPGLIFPLIILKRFNKDVSQYNARMSSSSLDEILLDYCHQIMEISNIYEKKQSCINTTVSRFKRLSLIWVVTIVALVLTTLARR